jgi:hypothetical protein
LQVLENKGEILLERAPLRRTSGASKRQVTGAGQQRAIDLLVLPRHSVFALPQQ